MSTVPVATTTALLALLALLPPATPAAATPAAAATASSSTRARGVAAADADRADRGVFLFTPDLVDAGGTTMARRVGRLAKDPAPVITAEHPWETSLFFYHSMIHPPDKPGEIWMYYSTETAHGCFLCLARSSDDGRSFTKPMDLGVVSFGGSTQNNLVLQLSKPNPGANATAGRPAGLRTATTVFVDTNPAVPPTERYKFTADGVADGQPMTPALALYGSADGVRWELLSAGSRQMRLWGDVGDTQPITFWDPRESRYQTYGRYEPGPRKCAHAVAAREVGYSAGAVNGSLFGAWTNVTAALGFAAEGPCTVRPPFFLRPLLRTR